MRDLDDIQSVYGLTFANISYSFWKARIWVHALWNYNENSTRWVYDSVQYFIENYRKDKNAHFDLGFITNFSHIKTTESQSVKMNIELQMK